MATEANGRGLRIVTFNILPFAYRTVADWAARQGHDLTLVVTTPGPASRRNSSYHEIVAAAPPKQEVIVTSTVGRLAPYLTTLAPDLILSFTFSYLIPPEVTTIPRLGAINLHPTALPSYRGPNPFRPLYDGATSLSATLHWTAPGFDTGAILSQQTRALPEEVDPQAIRTTMLAVVAAALEEGAARAIAGDPGRPQDDAAATYAARFGEDDDRLSWELTGWLFARRVLVLNMAGRQPTIALDGEEYAVLQAQPAAAPAANAIGNILTHDGDTRVVQVADGAVEVKLGPVSPEKVGGIF